MRLRLEQAKAEAAALEKGRKGPTEEDIRIKKEAFEEEREQARKRAKDNAGKPRVVVDLCSDTEDEGEDGVNAKSAVPEKATPEPTDTEAKSNDSRLKRLSVPLGRRASSSSSQKRSKSLNTPDAPTAADRAIPSIERSPSNGAALAAMTRARRFGAFGRRARIEFGFESDEEAVEDNGEEILF